MGLCAPAVVAANAALEQSTPYDSLVVIPGQFIEMAGVFQLMGRIGQRREGHAVPCKANARNAAGDRGGDGGGYFNAGEGDHCVWGGAKSWTKSYNSPRLCRYSTGLNPPNVSFIRFSLYQCKQLSSISINWSRLTPAMIGHRTFRSSAGRKSPHKQNYPANIPSWT